MNKWLFLLALVGLIAALPMAKAASGCCTGVSPCCHESAACCK